MRPSLFKVLKTARSIATMVVITALALYVYEYFKRADRQAAMDEAGLIREQTQALQAQASELNERLKSTNEAAVALQLEVATQRTAVDEARERQIRARYLSEGLQIAQMARVAIAEFYQTNLQWPAANAAAGLPEPAQMKGESLHRLQIGSKGVVTLTYDAKSGVDGGTIRLVPTSKAATVSWRCETSSYPDIAVLVPPCDYTAPTK